MCVCVCVCVCGLFCLFPGFSRGSEEHTFKLAVSRTAEAAAAAECSVAECIAKWSCFSAGRESEWRDGGKERPIIILLFIVNTC